MASGLPVVVSGVRALGEIVQDKVTGLLFPPLDAGALADALQLLLGNPELRRKLGANASDGSPATAPGRTTRPGTATRTPRLGAL